MLPNPRLDKSSSETYFLETSSRGHAGAQVLKVEGHVWEQKRVSCSCATGGSEMNVAMVLAVAFGKSQGEGGAVSNNCLILGHD